MGGNPAAGAGHLVPGAVTPGEDVRWVRPLRHNTGNEVTGGVAEVLLTDGRTLVRKELVRPGAARDAPLGHWRSSSEPRHWNYWRREAEAYTDPALRTSLVGTGLGMAGAEVAESPTGATLWLERVEGRLGSTFGLSDHVAVARCLGRWQAAGPLDRPWTSRGFLRAYSTSRPAAWAVLDDDAAWAHPLVRHCWPEGLRAGWRRLVGARERLLSLVEAAPRTRCHLDAWVCNAVRRPDGEVVLLDWSFVGDGALGEDLGNWLPDACNDLFWPAARLPELRDATLPAYLDGLREGGWSGDERVVRLAMTASAVKYAWLLPLMLATTDRREQIAYFRPVDPELLYTERGLVLAQLVAWCDEALALADRLGR